MPAYYKNYMGPLFPYPFRRPNPVLGTGLCNTPKLEIDFYWLLFHPATISMTTSGYVHGESGCMWLRSWFSTALRAGWCQLFFSAASGV
jgi:hypothetical protein